jgi:hypothetical protein
MLPLGTAAGGAAAQSHAAVYPPTDAASVKHVIVAPLTGAQSLMKVNPPTVSAVGPWVRGAPALSAAGVAIVVLDAPSDAEGRVASLRPIAQVRRDLEAGVAFARERFAGAAVHVGLFNATAPAIEAAMALRGVERVAVASAVLADARAVTLPPSKTPTLLVHAPTAQCEPAPMLEAEDFARRHGIGFIRAAYARVDAVGCTANSHHALRGSKTTSPRSSRVGCRAMRACPTSAPCRRACRGKSRSCTSTAPAPSAPTAWR